MFNPICNRPWKQHEKQKWLENVLKNLHKKLVTTIEEKPVKDNRRKPKYSSFPVKGRKKAQVKYPLVNAVQAEPSCQKEAEASVAAPKKDLPEAEKFWKYVDTCYELTLKACNVGGVGEPEKPQEPQEPSASEEPKKHVKLSRKKRKRDKKRMIERHRCFAKARPGFLTSVISDTNFFYPIIIRKPVLQDVRRHSSRISKPKTEMGSAEKTKKKLKAKRKLHSKPQQCEDSKPKMKKRKRKNSDSKAKSKSRVKSSLTESTTEKQD